MTYKISSSSGGETTSAGGIRQEIDEELLDTQLKMSMGPAIRSTKWECKSTTVV